MSHQTHSVCVLEVRAVQRVDDAHVRLLQRHHLGLDLQRRVAHVEILVAQLTLAAVRRVADVGLHPLDGRRSEQGLDGVRHGVLLG